MRSELRQIIAGKFIPGMHHGCNGNVLPSVLHTKPFVSTPKKY